MGSGCLDENTISAFFRAKLSPSEIADIDRHIDGCAECRVLLSSLAAREVSVGPFSATLFSSQWQKEPSNEPLTPLPDPSSERLVTGAVLADRFVIEARVGAGGMAEVYGARDRNGGARVAIKVPLGYASQDNSRFEREARLLVQLSHPAIVKHTANGRLPDDTPFLAMEWLEGEDLSQRLSHGPLGTEEALELGARIASALGAAHAVGIIHRDIKPSNIFLRHGTVRGATLIDFGVARQTASDGGSLATRTGTLLGTLGYMAPEQALGAKSADARADVFSLGCVLFEGLTGRRLFVGAHAVEVLAKLLTEPVPSPKSLVPSVPEALDALVLRMLERDPTKRPCDCAAIASELERIRAAGPDRPRRSRDAPRRARPGVIVAVAVGAVGAAFCAGAAWRYVQVAPLARPASPAALAASVEPPPLPSAPVVALPSLSSSSSASSAHADPGPNASPRSGRPRPKPQPSSDPFGNSRN